MLGWEREKSNGPGILDCEMGLAAHLILLANKTELYLTGQNKHLDVTNSSQSVGIARRSIRIDRSDEIPGLATFSSGVFSLLRRPLSFRSPYASPTLNQLNCTPLPISPILLHAPQPHVPWSPSPERFSTSVTSLFGEDQGWS